MPFPACLLALAVAAPPASVAHAVAGTKTVTVVRDGKTLPIAADMALFRADLLKVPVNGFLLVKVDRNELVVRIDEDLELYVKDIAVLDAEKRASTSWSDQVNQLLTPQEREQRGTARMVGWFVTPTAANVKTSTKARDVAPEPFEKAEEDVSKPNKAAPVPVAPAPPRAEPPAMPRQRTPGDLPAPRGGDAPKAQSSEGRTVGTSLEKKEEPAEGDPRSRGTAGAQLPPADVALRACVESVLAPLGAEVRARLGPTLLVQVRRSRGAVRVFLEGALPGDACIQQWAEAQPNLTERWQSFEVPLR